MFPWEQKTNFYMCSKIFSRKIKYSSCNLSSFKEKSTRQIFWKAVLEQNDSVRFSDGWSDSKTRTFYFLTSSFSRICLFWFSVDKILMKSVSSENKIRTRGGKVVLKERLAEFSQPSTRWQFFSCLLRLFWWFSCRVSTPFPFFWLVWVWWDWLFFPISVKREYKKTRLEWFQPSFLYGNI